MSARYSIVPSRAFEDPNLTPLDVCLLGLIGSFLGKDGEAAFPRQTVLAKRLGVARQSVNRSLGRLKEFGYVKCQAQFNESGGQIESLYWVKLDREESASGPSERPKRDTTSSPCHPSETPPGHPSETPPRHSRVTPPVTVAVTPRENIPNRTYPIEDSMSKTLRASDAGTTQALDVDPPPQPTGRPAEPALATKGSRSAEPSRPVSTTQAPTQARPDLQAAFEDLWGVWPEIGRKRSDSRAKCMRALEVAAKGRTPAAIVAASKAWLAAQRDVSFAPGLQRFLAAGKWEHFLADLLTPAPASTGSAPPNETEEEWQYRRLRRWFKALKETRVWAFAQGIDPRDDGAGYPSELYDEFQIERPRKPGPPWKPVNRVA
jgi:hypothetical protein